MRNDMSTYTQTFSGGIICPQDPIPEEIKIEDIAHALAQQPRFGGHLKQFLSVAQHSFLVSQYCDLGDALWGLLHDASEAYIADICRPVKKGLIGYKEAEDKLMAAVCKKFGLPPVMPASVKKADDLLICLESNQFLAPLRMEIWRTWPVDPAAYSEIVPWSWQEAERHFLDRFHMLSK
jgi:uncharacterized protein